MIRGLVLAGGKSSRFGTDKALANYNGATFIERAVSVLAALRLKPIVVTRKGADYSLAGCTMIYDKLPDKGPLGGIYTAMSIFKNTAFLVLTCDMPALTPAVISDLLKDHKPHFGATVYSIDGSSIEPFPGIYDPLLFEIIRDGLKSDDLSMQSLLDKVPAKKVVLWKGDPAIFSNINRKEDLISNRKL